MNEFENDVLVLEVDASLTKEAEDKLMKSIKESLSAARNGGAEPALILENGIRVAAVVHRDGSIDIR